MSRGGGRERRFRRLSKAVAWLLGSEGKERMNDSDRLSVFYYTGSVAILPQIRCTFRGKREAYLPAGK